VPPDPLPAICSSKIFEQQFLVFRKRSCLRQGTKKFDRRLAGNGQVILISDVTPQDIGDANAELIRGHFFNFAANLIELAQRDFPWQLRRRFRFLSAHEPPHNQAEP